MSDTPRTDEIKHNVAELAVWARKLERELEEANRSDTDLPLNLQLKAAREARGISLNALAKMSGIDTGNLWKYEHHGNGIGRDSLQRAVEQLGLTLGLVPITKERLPSE